MKRIEADEFLDCLDLYCPAPIFEVRKKIDDIPKGKILQVIADDSAAKEDFKHWTKTTGNELLGYYREGNKFIFYIKKS